MFRLFYVLSGGYKDVDYIPRWEALCGVWKRDVRPDIQSSTPAVRPAHRTLCRDWQVSPAHLSLAPPTLLWPLPHLPDHAHLMSVVWPAYITLWEVVMTLLLTLFSRTHVSLSLPRPHLLIGHTPLWQVDWLSATCQIWPFPHQVPPMLGHAHFIGYRNVCVCYIAASFTGIWCHD